MAACSSCNTKEATHLVVPILSMRKSEWCDECTESYEADPEHVVDDLAYFRLACLGDDCSFHD